MRTLYRYFPARQDLIDAPASVADQTAVVPLPQRLEDLEPWLVQASGTIRTLLEADGPPTISG